MSFNHKVFGDDYKASLSGYLKVWKASQKEVTAEGLQNAILRFRQKWSEYEYERDEEERKRQELESIEAVRCEEVTKIATCMDLPMDWENAFDTDTRTEGVHADNPSDALILSQINLGCVDIEYMASITGLSYKEIINGLRGSILQNPQTWDECFFKGWELKDEYLSGDLREKWKIAFYANKKYIGYFEDNVKAIEEVMPESVTSEDIYITLGSPWIPTDIIDDFIEHLVGRVFKHKRIDCKTQFDEITGTWELPHKDYWWNHTAKANYFGTTRIEAIEILEKSLNSRSAEVYDWVSVPGRKTKKKVLNREETALALEKQRMMIQHFQKWVWENPERKERLEEIFAQRYCSIRTRKYDGSFLTFPEMSKEISLFGYQKDAVARILFSPNTLLAHDVGAGKTYVMIAAGMEQVRMGLSKKNLYVVPNNIIGQWRDLFYKMYPNVRLLCVEPKTFVPSKRKEVLRKIQDGGYDAILMAYSSFDMIPLSSSYYLEKLKDERKMIEREIRRHKQPMQSLENRLKRNQKETVKLLTDMINHSEMPYFDELGITGLFVDEAHNFKNVPVDTRINNVYGVAGSGSAKCKEMYEKVKYIQKNNNGGGVVFATGTPITNSLTDLFVMQKYLQEGMLSALDLQNFDAWIGMFAERTTQFEIDVDTKNYRLKTRFSKFHNLPELTVLLSTVTDFHHVTYESDLPEFNGYTDELIPKTRSLDVYLRSISGRADAVRQNKVKRTEDNMLKITTDGRKAALDLRLVDRLIPFNDYCKAARCAEQVSRIYRESEQERGTQLIFCDTSVPSDKFNLYDEMAKRLKKHGIPSHEIAFVHDAKTDKERSKLFEQVRNGTIRVLLGSTFKLGTGVNVQDRLIAIHHLDVPWRPSDMVQREGRIIRQGNRNAEVFIYRYITEGSFDAYSWQILESKKAFISALLSGTNSKRDENDVDNTVLDYAEVKALAVGNPLIKKRVETENELRRNIILRNKAQETREHLELLSQKLPSQIEDAHQKLKDANSDAKMLKLSRREYSLDEKKDIRIAIFNAISGNVMQEEERFVCEYNGFSVILPKHMLLEKPFIYLQGKGRYVVSLGFGDTGIIIRMDHFLDGFKELIKIYKTNYKRLQEEQKSVSEQLTQHEPYSEKIIGLKAELSELDKKLGVVES